MALHMELIGGFPTQLIPGANVRKSTISLGPDVSPANTASGPTKRRS